MESILYQCVSFFASISGIICGIGGRAINKHIDSRAVDKLFLVLTGVIILISFYNTWRYLSL